MFDRGIAVIAITRRGVETVLRIKAVLEKLNFPCTAYAPEKYRQEGVVSLNKKLDEFVKEIYRKVDAIVAVMASGIIIRAVAPYLESKLVDPAVLCVDAPGRFVISLLSGHYGRANELARLIAEGINAVPVITTASDVMGRQCIEELAFTLRLSIVNPETVVAVNSVLVNGGRLALVLVGDVKIPENRISGYEIKKADKIEKALKILRNFDAGAIITKSKVSTEQLTKPTTILRPKTVVVGLGARENISEKEVTEAVKYALARVDVPLERVDRLATVSIKKDSQSILSAAEKLGLPITFLDIDVLRAFNHADLSPDSPLVEQKIGVGGVCERVALIEAGTNAKLILKKIKLNGVTVAIAEGE
ncbi:MAG: cobalt-precorrin 5A hydrolase [Candidatus Bathyarchaeota archaeon]|nr:cobalt-precorrin 5A hydrolase [Candidatus Bathyarchaeota archaeon]